VTGDIVVDASVAIKWFVHETDSDRAQWLFNPDVKRIAPDFALAEIANGLRRKERVGDMPQDAVRRSVASMPRLFHRLVTCSDVMTTSIRLSQALDHSVYDCIYLAVAQSLAAPLITADTKFVAKLASSPHAANVVLLSRWQG
jgi:predicted nucleic acid-binding protein